MEATEGLLLPEYVALLGIVQAVELEILLAYS